ncbi:MAG: outer membrane lipoprotein carrier protein LolA [Gemmatimonadetes bacterium]|nr:outer membrane lipoprotein carrier protein LolA [Gemmatimonadota bacterium]NNM32576.1 outer membrane lipoprotein carrier protein LolA [Gemmatimonadota bacterium]
MKSGWAALALIVAAVSPIPASAQSAMDQMEAAASRYRNIRSLCSDFQQVMNVRLLRRTIHSEGRVCQERPNRFAMRFTDPEGDLVVADGEYFWVYYPSLNEDQVVRYPMTRRPGGYDFFREFLSDPGIKYRAADGGTEDVGGKTCRIVELEPTGEAAYRYARVWLDPETDLICKLEIHQENSTVRTLTLRGLSINPVLDAREFAFVVPEGARVVDPPS